MRADERGHFFTSRLRASNAWPTVVAIAIGANLPVEFDDDEHTTTLRFVYRSNLPQSNPATGSGPPVAVSSYSHSAPPFEGLEGSGRDRQKLNEPMLNGGELR